MKKAINGDPIVIFVPVIVSRLITVTALLNFINFSIFLLSEYKFKTYMQLAIDVLSV